MASWRAPDFQADSRWSPVRVRLLMSDTWGLIPAAFRVVEGYESLEILGENVVQIPIYLRVTDYTGAQPTADVVVT